MTDQTINLSIGDREYLLPRTITAAPLADGTPVDITTDPISVLISSAPHVTSGNWITPADPDILEHPTADTAVVQLLIGGVHVLDPGTYYVRVRVGDTPEIVSRLTPGRLFIV